MPLVSLLDFWKRDPETAPNLVAWQTLPPRPAQTHPFPEDLSAPVKQALIATGIHTLYSHQFEAWTHRPRRRKRNSLHRYRQRKDPRLQPACLCFITKQPKRSRALSLPHQSPRTRPAFQPPITNY